MGIELERTYAHGPDGLLARGYAGRELTVYVKVRRFLDGYSLASSAIWNGCPRKREYFRRILKADSLSVNHDKSVSSGITHLLGSCCPPAVRLCVGPVVVDAFKGHSWWSFSHIGQEPLKLTPRRVNGNASVPIVFGALGIR